MVLEPTPHSTRTCLRYQGFEWLNPLFELVVVLILFVEDLETIYGDEFIHFID